MPGVPHPRTVVIILLLGFGVFFFFMPGVPRHVETTIPFLQVTYLRWRARRLLIRHFRDVTLLPPNSHGKTQ